LQKKLTKAEIVESIFQKTNSNKRELFVIVEAFFEEIKDALKHGRIVEFRCFGTFEVHQRAGRKARNPKTGEKVRTDDHGVVFFRPGRELKTLVRDVTNIIGPAGPTGPGRESGSDDPISLSDFSAAQDDPPDASHAPD